MASPVVHVTLLAPGLGRDAASCAVLWSDAQALQPWQSRFCKLLAQKQWNGQHLPVAELLIGKGRDSRHETDGKMQDVLICADPVHLRADRDTARLVPAAMLSLSDAEADALLQAINEFLAEDDLRLSRSDACHWYMHGMDGSALLTYPPEFLSQRNASAFLPEGEASGDWKRLMTELQMLLHSHPVNTQREQRGLMPVNSLWFWGGAPLAASSDEPTPPRRIHADEPFAVALARHLGLECLPLDEFDPAGVDSDVLVVDRRLEQAMLARDETAVVQARQRLLDEWIACWESRLQQGEDFTLDIFDEDGMHGRLDAEVLRQMAKAAKVGSPQSGASLSGAAQGLSEKASALWRRLTGSR